MIQKKIYIMLMVPLAVAALDIRADSVYGLTNDGQVAVNHHPQVPVVASRPTTIKELIDYSQEVATHLSLCKDDSASQLVVAEVKKNAQLQWFNEQDYKVRYAACLQELARQRCTRNSSINDILALAKDATKLVYTLQTLKDFADRVHLAITRDSRYRTNAWLPWRGHDANMKKNEQIIADMQRQNDEEYTRWRKTLSEDFKLKQAIEAALVVKRLS